MPPKRKRTGEPKEEPKEDLLSELHSLVEQRSLRDLHAWQRKVLLKLQESSKQLEDTKKRHQKQKETLGAWKYEQQVLQHEISDRRSLGLNRLKELARQEVDGDEDVLEKYLPADVSDPEAKDQIIQHLHNEINQRGRLRSQWQQQQDHLETIRSQIRDAESYLQSLVAPVATMEKAASHLGSVNKDRKRLETASALSAPLYTLFRQLHLCTENSSSESVAIANNSVTLQLTVAKNKKVTIHFHDAEDGLVSVAKPTGCGQSLDQALLLRELFPNDTGVELENDRTIYHWVNHLAGVWSLPEQAPAQQPTPSTRVVLRELRLRVQANAALKQSISVLSNKKALPKLPYETDSTWKSNTNIRSFKMESDDGVQRVYRVEFSKKGDTLECSVSIQAARYPGFRPSWKLQEGDLYDEKLAELEARVNGIEMDDNHEWVLVEQLRLIMEHVDS